MTHAVAPRPRFGAVVSSLRGNRGFQLLWTSNLFFFGGAWTQTLVLGWLAYEITGSEFLVAVFGAARLAPLLLGPLSGALADRFDRVRLLLIACGWALLAISVIALLASTGMLTYWGLVIGGFAIGMAQSPSQPARASLVASLVPARELSNANALNSLAMNMTQVVGPALGGVMIATLGAPLTLWISTAWYALSFVLLLPLQRRIAAEPAPAEPAHEPVLAMVASGLRYVAGNRLAIAVLAVTVVANALIWPIFQSLMPVIAEDSLGLDAVGLGALLTFSGVGGLIGAVVIAAMGDFRRKGAVFVLGTAAWGVLWAVFSQVHSPTLGFVLMAAVGLASATFGVLQTTLLLVVVEPAMHGRALGLQELAIGVMPIATLVLGAIAQGIGVGATTLIAGILLAVGMAIVARVVPEVLAVSGSAADAASAAIAPAAPAES